MTNIRLELAPTISAAPVAQQDPTATPVVTSADPARAPTLTPLDIVFARLLGAGLILLPVGWWMVRVRLQARMPAANN